LKPAAIDPPPIHDLQWEGVQGKVAWDIGANAGQTIEHLLKRFEQIVAFEPAQECQVWLSGYSDHPNVTIVPIAVTNQDAPVDLLVLPDQIETGQLVTKGTHGMEWSQALPEGIHRTVPGSTVDTLVATYPVPDFIKIDVEGHELMVLEGAIQTLTYCGPQLLIEFHAPELYTGCLELLKRVGYDPTTIRHPWYEPESQMWYQHGWLKATAKG
jgi:FkbM family methyltransferase